MIQVEEINGELWIKASDYGQAVIRAVEAEREAMVAEAAKQGWAMRNDDPFEDAVREIANIRARGNT